MKRGLGCLRAQERTWGAARGAEPRFGSSCYSAECPGTRSPAGPGSLHAARSLVGSGRKDAHRPHHCHYHLTSFPKASKTPTLLTHNSDKQTEAWRAELPWCLFLFLWVQEQQGEVLSSLQNKHGHAFYLAENPASGILLPCGVCMSGWQLLPEPVLMGL